jgi:hypothetical protein
VIHPEIVKAEFRFRIAKILRLKTMNTPNFPGRSETIHDDRLSAALEIRERLQAGDASFDYFNVPRQDTAFFQLAKNVNTEPIVSSP